VHIGLPAGEHGRVAEFSWPGAVPDDADRSDLDPGRLMEHNAYFNPGGLSGGGVVNTASWRAAEVPATNGHGTARGVARVYAALAAGGALGGVRVVDEGALADAVTEQVYGEDKILHRRSRFGLGFQLTQPERPMGPRREAGPQGPGREAGPQGPGREAGPRGPGPLDPGQAAFGHFGAGGSLGFCDPEAGLAVGYVTGQMGPRWQNPRNRALIDAIYACM
jgi:CubicO group peptidase (beta-lactamase class C family)